MSAGAAADINLLAVDTDTTGNTTTAAASVTPHVETLGTIDPCTTVANGSTFTIDVVVDAVPTYSGAPAGDFTGMSAFGFNLVYDSSILTITGANAKFIIASGGTGYVPFSFSDSPPGPANDFSVSEADLSTNYDDGAGVLYRFTVTAIANGATELAIDGDPLLLGNPQILSSDSSVYTIGTVQNGSINVTTLGTEPCVPVTPTPSPTPVPTTVQFLVHKDFSDKPSSDTTDVTIALSCTNATHTDEDPGASEADPANFTVTATGANPTCTATETVPGGYTAVQTDCANKAVAPSLTPVTCTIVNTTTATLKVTKIYSDATTTAVDVTPNCTAGTIISPTPPQSVPTGATGVTFTLSAFPAGASCTVSETGGEPGYAEDLTASTCDDAQSITPGVAATCHIDNVPSVATVNVSKTFIPANPTGTVTVSLSCTSGIITGGNGADAHTSTITGDSSAPPFTVTAFNAGATCTVSETVPVAGYNLTGSSADCTTAPLSSGGTLNCALTNQTHAQITVNKVYSPAGPATTVPVDATCDDGTITPTSNTVDPATPGATQFTARGFADGATCQFVENPVPAGYSAGYSTDCNPTLATTGSYTCTITNTLNSATFTVNKDFSDKPSNDTTTVSVTLNCGGVGTIVTNPTDASEAAPAAFTVTGIPAAGATCTATEGTAPSGYTSSGCTTGVPLPANGSASCTITNTLNSATFTVNKDFSDKPSNDTTTVSVTLNCGGVGTIVTNPTDASEAAPAAFTVTGIPAAGATCTATEGTAPSGYTSSGCTTGVPLPANGSASCTITNAITATFTVSKDFSDDASISATVSLACAPNGGTVTGGNVSANSGTVTEATPRQFTVTGYSGDPTCTATEQPVPGYTSTGTCNAALIAGGTCTVTNTPRDATITVSKEYSPAGPTDSALVTVTCSSASPNLSVSPSTATAVTPGTPVTFHVKGFNPGDHCTATESPEPAGYTAVYAGCESQAVVDGQDFPCTITNTLNTATFTVNKVYSPSSITTPVAIHITCTSGTPDADSGFADPNTPFTTTIRGFNSAGATCTATEDPPQGFIVSTNCTSVLLLVDGTLSCTITNATAPTITPTPPVTPTPVPTIFHPTATPTLSPGTFGLGDTDCDGNLTPIDLLALLAYVASHQSSVTAQGAGCTPIGEQAGTHLKGDVNCSGAVDDEDALTVLLALAGLPLGLPDGCPGP